MIEANTLADALRVVKPAVGARADRPILSGVKLCADGERLAVTATDIDLTIEAHVPCGTPLECVVPYAPLASFAGHVSGLVTITPGDTITLEAGNARLELRPYPYAEWPAIAHSDTDPVELDGDALDRLSRVIHAASHNDAKPVLTGVKLGAGMAVATDAYRIAMVATPDLPDVVVPGNLLSALIADAGNGATLTGDGNRVTFRAGTTTWTATTLPGDYPNCARLVPDTSPHHITVQRERLLAAVDLVGMFKGGANPIRLEPRGGLLAVRTIGDQGEVTDAIECDTDFDQPIAVRAQSLADALHVMRCDEARFEITDPGRPAVLRDGPLTLLFMLLKTNGE